MERDMTPEERHWQGKSYIILEGLGRVEILDDAGITKRRLLWKQTENEKK